MHVSVGVGPYILHKTKCDENSDLSTTYLGKKYEGLNKLGKYQRFPILEQGYTTGKLLDGTENIETGKSLMCKYII